MVVLKNVFAHLKAMNECSLAAFVAGITSHLATLLKLMMSFNKVTITVRCNFCAAYRLLAYVAPGDVGLLVGEDDCLRSRC